MPTVQPGLGRKLLDGHGSKVSNPGERKQAGLAGALKREGDTFFMVKPWD